MICELPDKKLSLNVRLARCFSASVSRVVTEGTVSLKTLHQSARLGLFQDADFAGDVTDSESTPGSVLCILGSHTFVPISWPCKKRQLFHTAAPKQESSQETLV